MSILSKNNPAISELEGAVERAVFETMENWIFAEAIRVKNDEWIPSILRESASIRLGSFGELELFLEPGFLTGVAKALFAPDESIPTPEKKEDVFLELLNLIAGRAAAFLNEKGFAIEMNLPRIEIRRDLPKRDTIYWTFWSESLGKMIVVYSPCKT
ncbi:MAG: hypothetical protein JNM63_05335 [Spirochaetia bacterium]|nr:hypothetical protein [Spirochaetia bacterium]